jgi:hypothetical protein
MRKMVIGVVATLALAALIAAALSSRVAAQPTASPRGLPAIQPRTSQVGGSGPSFTAKDVAQYVQGHRVPHDVYSAGPQRQTIAAVKFIASRDVSVLLHGEATGFPDGTLLCYVELHGNFSFLGPQNVVLSYNRGYEVFDGQTGNLVMAGGLP